MRFKEGVVWLAGFPVLDEARDICEGVHWEVRGWEMTVTSCREGDHSKNSKHYYRPSDLTRWPKDPNGSQGAFDVRTWLYDNATAKKQQLEWKQLTDEAKGVLAAKMQAALDARWEGRFWVRVEKTHIHVQDNGVQGIMTA